MLLDRMVGALGLLAIAATLVACGGGGGGGAGAALPVEAKFQAAGPAGVLQLAGADAAGVGYTVYYPSTLASDGFANPVITWGNGSFGSCADPRSAQAYGRHLASWGFVVVCANIEQTGTGNEIWSAVQFMRAENGRDGSVFRGQLDTASIGAAGHSQGATGALNANLQSAGAIRSTVALAFVDPADHGGPQNVPPLAQVQGPVLLLSGCADPVTTNQANYFRAFTAPVARACRLDATHVGMLAASLAYTAAWFTSTLRGDAMARGAFVGSGDSAPEVARNPGWTDWEAARLP
jgi:hypothetical protein